MMIYQNKYFSKTYLILPCLFLLAASIACTVDEGIVQPTQTPRAETDNDYPEHDSGVDVGMEEQVEQEAQPPSSNAETDCQESPLAGLIFGDRNQDGESLWQVGTCGGHIHLSAQSNVQISPDGSQALYTKDDDIWIEDLFTGDQHNLTKTPDRIEVDPQWWRGHDNLVVFGSWGSEEDLGFTTGSLSLISTDGGDYRVLVDQPSNTTSSPQPGGSMIAYDLGDTAWIYNLDMGESEFFDISVYGLNIHKGMKIGSPSWSPDGKKLAWWVGGVFSPSIDGTVGLAVFDLEGRSGELLHPYTPIGTGGWLPAPVWSPDGKWLAVVTLSEAHKADLWTIRSDSGEEHLLGFASNPVWHPDSSTLVFKDLSDEGVKSIEVDDWKLQSLDMPPGSVPVNWQGISRNFSGEGQQPATEGEPTFGPAIYFAASPEMASSRSVFADGTPEIFAIWPYRNMREGLTVRMEWYLNGDIWLEREEPWDYNKYGAQGMLTDININDFDQGLEPGRYQLRLFIDGQEQQLGIKESFSSAYIEISAPIGISPHVSPDYSQMAIVEPPGTLILQEVETQEQRTLLSVEEISSLAWYPDGIFILFSIRDRSDQQINPGAPRFVDELWVVNLETDEAYPFQDQFGQVTGTGLHHPYVSPDGLYVAAVEGTGWADACFVASTLWVKEIGISGNRLQEVFSHYQNSFTVDPTPDNGEMYVKRIVGWDSPTHLKVELGWTCTVENLAGIYLLDMASMMAQKIEDPG